MDDILLTIAVVAVVTVLLTLHARRRSGRSWIGTVETVEEATRTRAQDADDPGTTERVVVVRYLTTTGKRVKLEFPPQQFRSLYPEGLAAGDRVEKVGGAWYPTRLA